MNEVKASLIKTRRIIFTPSVELKDELAATSIQITCYDRNGNEIKRVTSTDPGTVEDPENPENPNTGGDNGDSSQGGSTQGGNSGDDDESGKN